MGRTSLRQVAEFMDVGDAPVGLRHTMSHHRWLGTEPEGSLAALVGRHDHSARVELRFLSYNTFLMRVRIGLAKALAHAAVKPWDLIDALGVAPKDVLDEFGSICDLLPSGPGPIPGAREACNFAGDAVGYVIDFFGGIKAVVNAIVDASGAEAVIAMVLKIAKVPSELVLRRKPALEPRAREIGDVLAAEGFDLAALGEVWNANLRHELVTHWQLPASDTHLAVGRPEDAVSMGDGLLVGCPVGRITEVVRHGFHTRGVDRSDLQLVDLLADDELWAHKGVLLARVDLGIGELDLYLTHMYFGTGLGVSDAAPYVALFSPGAGALLAAAQPPNDDERRAVRSAQLDELAGFIEATHKPANVAVVCGDLNIDANGSVAEYAGWEALATFRDRLGLEDRWVAASHDFHGATAGGSMAQMCPLDPADPAVCRDDAAANGGAGGRIDHLLVESPRAAHGYNLDVTRVRRRHFTRPQATDGQAHMSDHLGLDCTLMATPR